jgi:hypothetical protein
VQIKLPLLPEKETFETFASADELMTFLGKERDVWAVLQLEPLRGRFHSFQNDIRDGVSQCRDNPETLEKQISHIIRRYGNPGGGEAPLIYSKTIKGQQIQKIGEGSPDAALGAYSQLAGIKQDKIHNSLILFGAISAALFQGAGRSNRAEAELHAALDARTRIEQLRDEMDALRTDYAAKLEETVHDLKTASTQLDELRATSQDSLKGTLDSCSTEFTTLSKGWEQGVKQFDEHANRKLNELEKLYEEKLQLEAPVKHWEKMEKSYHDRGRKWLAGAVAVTLAFVVLLLSILYMPPATFENQSFAGMTGVRALILLGLVVSVAVYLIRLLFKLSISAFHLSRDARERALLTYFYLALLNTSDKNITAEQRQIVFQSLFSRADTGLLRSEGPSMPAGSIDSIVGAFKDHPHR